MRAQVPRALSAACPRRPPGWIDLRLRHERGRDVDDPANGCRVVHRLHDGGQDATEGRRQGRAEGHVERAPGERPARHHRRRHLRHLRQLGRGLQSSPGVRSPGQAVRRRIARLLLCERPRPHQGPRRQLRPAVARCHEQRCADRSAGEIQSCGVGRPPPGRRHLEAACRRHDAHLPGGQRQLAQVQGHRPQRLRRGAGGPDEPHGRLGAVPGGGAAASLDRHLSASWARPSTSPGRSRPMARQRGAALPSAARCRTRCGRSPFESSARATL
mmetsp:Transcript_1158/g.3042  ORF Transcript_1158/g.3042 Transcript_1158/m.3042 type:complete len:272 (-) Transcript_1158:6-821(-)